MDFQETERIRVIVDRLYAACGPLGRGDVLPHEAIEEIAGVARHTGHYQYVKDKLNRRMEKERGISIWIDREIGYRLCTPEEQIEIGRHRTRRARRQVRRGYRSVAALPVAELAAHEQEARSKQLERLARSHRQLTAELAIGAIGASSRTVYFRPSRQPAGA